MSLNDALLYTFSQIREEALRATNGLEAAALAWRPDQQANSIAWLVWHLARVEDSHVMEIAGREQLWVAEDWAPRFGLPAGYRDTGYGHGPEQVAQIAPDDPAVLRGYHERVLDAVADVIRDMGSDDFERI